MSILTVLRRTLALAFALLLTWSALAQPHRPIRGMTTVPSERREGLIQALSELVDLYRRMDWDGVFERLASIPPVDESAAEFRSRLSGTYPTNVGKKLVSFEVESIVEQPAAQWAVWGCAALKGRAKRLTQERWIVVASWERGRWLFTELRPAVQLDAKKPLRCSSTR